MESKTRKSTEVQEKPQKELIKKHYQICYKITEGVEFSEKEHLSGELKKRLDSDETQTFTRSIEVCAFTLKQVREKAFGVIVKSHNHFNKVSKIAIEQIIQTDLSKFYTNDQLERMVDLTM